MSDKAREPETWLCWKELVTVEGEAGPRLLAPGAASSPPLTHARLWLFKTAADAEFVKNERAPDEDWYLVEMTLTVVAHHPPAPEADDD
jgi:hypothetical protein